MIDRLEQNSTLHDCTQRFDKLGIAYMLTGSMALVHYAMPRMTADIDVVVEIQSNDANKIIAEFEPDYYVPRDTVRQAIARGSMFNLLHQQSLIKIDCIIRKNDEYQNQAFERRTKALYAKDFEIWIISREDLILSKLNWAKKTNSEMQLRDAANILRHDYDQIYVATWSSKLGISDLLKKALEMLKSTDAT